MVGCIGPEVLKYMPSFLASGMLSTDSAEELADFLPFIGLMIHKFEVLQKIYKS
jgi:exportin-T